MAKATGKRKGPYSKITEKALQIFERCICHGWSIAASCEAAAIAESSLYAYQSQRPEFKHKIAMLRQRKELKARFNIAHALECGDVATSKWFLEHKAHDFANRRTVAMGTKQELDEESVITILTKLVAVSQQRRAGLEGGVSATL